MQIDKKLYEEIKEYCNFNSIKITPFINELLRKAFIREKYGDAPFKNNITTNVMSNFDETNLPKYETNKNDTIMYVKENLTSKNNKRKLTK